MSDSQIVIPDHLKPADGRFGSGPSKVRPEALAALAATGTSYLGTSHRQKTVKDVVRRVRTGLADLFALPDGYEVVLGNGGTTAFWDIATLNLVESRAQHLVFGEFSSKFAAATKAAPFLDDPSVVSAEPGTHPMARAE
ncbi:MAG: phosphoserine transaminase, partial [Actinomycetes bacterium]